MGKSFKKSPVYKATNRGMKKHANRKVRRSAFVPSFRGYRKVFSSYTLCDYRFFRERPRFLLRIAPSGIPEEEEPIALRRWEKFYLRK